MDCFWHTPRRVETEAALFTEVPGRKILRSSSSLRVTRKSMRAGLSLERDAPPCWSLADFGDPYGHAKPTQSYPLVVVLVVVVVLAVVAVADFGDDCGFSYEQATLEQVGVERLVQRFGRLGGQLGVDAL